MVCWPGTGRTTTAGGGSNWAKGFATITGDGVKRKGRLASIAAEGSETNGEEKTGGKQGKKECLRC